MIESDPKGALEAPRRRRRPARLFLVAFAALLVVMVPVSFWRYSSIGFELRGHDGPDWVNRSYRLQWPGDGSVGFLFQRQQKPIFEPLDPFDIAGRVLQPPQRREPVSAWNRAGFWRVRADEAAGEESVHTRWTAIPSWLPAAALVVAVLASRGAARTGIPGAPARGRPDASA